MNRELTEWLVMGAIVLFCTGWITISKWGFWFWPAEFTADKYGRLITEVRLNKKVAPNTMSAKLFIHDECHRRGIGVIEQWETDEEGRVIKRPGYDRVLTNRSYGFIRLVWEDEGGAICQG